MVGSEALFRILVGDYRVLYEVKNAVLTIFIIKVGHRKNIYR
jgi:mRNA interferase RelE/StbE